MFSAISGFPKRVLIPAIEENPLLILHHKRVLEQFGRLFKRLETETSFYTSNRYGSYRIVYRFDLTHHRLNTAFPVHRLFKHRPP